jgi:hypothetical protein
MDSFEVITYAYAVITPIWLTTFVVSSIQTHKLVQSQNDKLKRMYERYNPTDIQYIKTFDLKNDQTLLKDTFGRSRRIEQDWNDLASRIAKELEKRERRH